MQTVKIIVEDADREYFERVKQEIMEETRKIVKSVLMRTLFIVERYAQFRCVELNDNGLKTNIRTKVAETDRGVVLSIELTPVEEFINEFVRKASFWRMVRRMEREYRQKGRAVEYEEENLRAKAVVTGGGGGSEKA